MVKGWATWELQPTGGGTGELGTQRGWGGELNNLCWERAGTCNVNPCARNWAVRGTELGLGTGKESGNWELGLGTGSTGRELNWARAGTRGHPELELRGAARGPCEREREREREREPGINWSTGNWELGTGSGATGNWELGNQPANLGTGNVGTNAQT